MPQHNNRILRYRPFYFYVSDNIVMDKKYRKRCRTALPLALVVLSILYLFVICCLGPLQSEQVKTNQTPSTCIVISTDESKCEESRSDSSERNTYSAGIVPYLPALGGLASGI